MRDTDDMRDLKREYMKLVRAHGVDVTEFAAFKKSLLDMNRRHRREAIKMYLRIISKVDRKTRGKTVVPSKGARG